MATWTIINPIGNLRPITSTETTLGQMYLGMRVLAADVSLSTPLVSEFIYCVGVASTIATDWVTIAEDFATIRLVADADGPVGIAMSANVANQYGYYHIYGNGVGGSGAAITDGAKIYIHGTAGLVDDAVVDGDLVHNALCRSTIGGAAITGDFQIWYPYTDNIPGND